MSIKVLSESETRSEILRGFDRFFDEDLFSYDSLLAENKNIFSDHFQKFLGYY